MNTALYVVGTRAYLKSLLQVIEGGKARVCEVCGVNPADRVCASCCGWVQRENARLTDPQGVA